MRLRDWLRPGWVFYVAAVLVFYVTAVHADGGVIRSGLDLVLRTIT